MSKKITLSLIALIASLLMLVAAPTASAGDTPCTGALTGTFDNVVVPPNARCTLSSATVRGNVKALENSQLVIQSSTIHGNVEGDKADLVQVNSSTVRGNITIKEGGPASAPFPVGTISCFGAPATVTVCEALVLSTTIQEGNVQIEKMVGDVAVLSSRVLKGNVKIEDNSVGLELLFIVNNTIAQDLQVFKNSGTATNRSVTNNTVGQSIQCKENQLPFTGGPNTAPKKEDQCF